MSRCLDCESWINLSFDTGSIIISTPSRDCESTYLNSSLYMVNQLQRSDLQCHASTIETLYSIAVNLSEIENFYASLFYGSMRSTNLTSARIEY